MEVVAVASSMQNQSGAASGSGYGSGSNGACVCNCTGAQVQGMDICECANRFTFLTAGFNFYVECLRFSRVGTMKSSSFKGNLSV